MMLIFLILMSFSTWGMSCLSSQGKEILSFDFPARESGLKKRILVVGSIHGDEPQAFELSHLWLKRLQEIKTPSNHWRIIPVLNPDGVELKTRTNAHKIDLNRNFPTKDWEELSHKFWKKKQPVDPRKFPGDKPGSEVEVTCLINHVNEFKPDLIVSIHTPYGLFDFDGPSNKKIRTSLLPWRRLGTYPGSLGRWAWDERGIPVLTIELSPSNFSKQREQFVLLQDKMSDLLL